MMMITPLVEPYETADKFAKHFQSVYYNLCIWAFS
jgi:hypothetical protein